MNEQSKASSRAITALILGIVRIICCPLVAPIAWYLGAQEGKAVASGAAPAAGEGLAKAGMILGIIGTVFLALWVIYIFVFGGMAVLSGLMNQ
jgi:hypothetical protein